MPKRLLFAIARLAVGCLVTWSPARARATPPILAAPDPSGVEPPAVADRRLVARLVAREPDVVTPIGLAVDGAGRLYVLESHTHFRPADYAGPPRDRVLRFSDRDGDGHFEERLVFADELHHAMHLALAPDGALYVAERARVLRLRDRDGDGLADERGIVLALETTGDYPHNGLGSLAFSPDGWLYVGLGENRGKPWTLHGSDGRSLSDLEGGAGGMVLRVRPDGRELQVYATRFWNPFGLGFHGAHLLAADNDAETRPPNRLLDVIEGGDYGYAYRHGEAASHPFQAWNGELPGTLPMIGPVGEAATAVLSTRALRLGLPDGVLVASWADRRIELHRLRPSGATLAARMSILVQGGRSFRPVALAAAPDGALFFTDWVARSYPVHGAGRIWRLGPARGRPGPPPRAPAGAAGKPALARLLAGGAEPERALVTALQARDPFVHATAVTALARPARADLASALVEHRHAGVRLGALLALRRLGAAALGPRLAHLLGDPDERVRIAALIAAAEDRLLEGGRADALHAAVAARAPSAQLLRVYRAAAALLGVAVRPELAPPDTAGWVELLSGRRAPALETARDAVWALEAIGDDAALVALERAAAGHADAVVRADAAAALARHGRFGAARALLREQAPALRIAAVRALQPATGDPEIEAELRGLLAPLARSARGPDAVLREELRFVLQDERVAAEPRPRTQADWARALATRRGDPHAGRRAFMSPGLGCSRCHRAGALGQQVGPPLSYMGGELPARLLESLLEPSVDVVWGARLFETTDGVLHVGMGRAPLPDGGVSFVNAAGQRVEIPAAELARETAADTSLMPDGLHEGVTVQGFADLFAFLRSLR